MAHHSSERDDISLHVPARCPRRLTCFKKATDDMAFQKDQLPIIILLDINAKKLGIDSIESVDEAYQGEMPKEKSRRPHYIVDLRANLRTLTLLCLGLPSLEDHFTGHLCQLNTDFTIECKPTPYKFISEHSSVRENLGKKGHQERPVSESLTQEPCDFLTDILVAGIDKKVSPNEGSNVSDFLSKLANQGTLSQDFVRTAHSEPVSFAHVVKQLGIPCVILDDYLDFLGFKRTVKNHIDGRGGSK